ncbi:MAG: efflux RND transporter permease subunit [Desulfobacterales bacterium]
MWRTPCARRRLADLTGVRAFPVMRQGLGGGVRKPVQFVIGGPNYEEIARWRDRLPAKAAENSNLIDLDHDYKESKPQLQVVIDRDRAGDFGVSIATIGRTLESKLGSRRVTTFIENGEEYDVLVEGEDETYRSSADLANIPVRSERTGQLVPLVNLIRVEEFADSAALNRTNRIRSITIEAGLGEGYSLGEAVSYLQELEEAIWEASSKRLRPILMTGVTTVVGALPLVLSSGAGTEARTVISIVVIAGVTVATTLTVVVIPCAYRVLARCTTPPQATARELERQLKLGSGAI